MIAAEDCTTMAEVRAGVDGLDAEIVRLLGLRFRFMEAAARIKPDRSAVRDEGRKAQVLQNVRAAAHHANAPEELVERIYEMLVEGSIAYEFERYDERRSSQ